jgi:hypothetical protein
MEQFTASWQAIILKFFSTVSFDFFPQSFSGDIFRFLELLS